MRPAVAACDVRNHATELTEMAGSALEIAAVCDVLHVEPGNLAHCLLAAVAAARLAPDAEYGAVELVLEAARFCTATSQPRSLWAGALRGTMHSLQGALIHGNEPNARGGLHLLLAAYERLGEQHRTQDMRLRLIMGLLSEGLADQAAELVRAARHAAVRLPEQDVVLGVADADILLSQGDITEAEQLARLLTSRVGHNRPTRRSSRRSWPRSRCSGVTMPQPAGRWTRSRLRRATSRPSVTAQLTLRTDDA